MSAGELFGGDRRECRGSSEVPALGEPDAPARESTCFFGGLDTFGDEARAEVRRERDQRNEEASAGRVGSDSMDQCAIDLDDIRGQVNDVAQARVAGTCVIDREPQAGRSQIA